MKKFLAGVLFPAGLYLCSTNLCSAGLLDVWHWRNPPPQGNDLRGAFCGNGRFFLVGDAGALVTSLDGITWTNQESGTNRDLYAAAFGNGVFLVAGTNGVISTSSNGVSWSLR